MSPTAQAGLFIGPNYRLFLRVSTLVCIKETELLKHSPMHNFSETTTVPLLINTSQFSCTFPALACLQANALAALSQSPQTELDTVLKKQEFQFLGTQKHI